MLSSATKSSYWGTKLRTLINRARTTMGLLQSQSPSFPFISVSASVSLRSFFPSKILFFGAKTFHFRFGFHGFRFLVRLSFFLSEFVLNRFLVAFEAQLGRKSVGAFVRETRFVFGQIIFLSHETVQLNLPDKELQSTVEVFEPKLRC